MLELLQHLTFTSCWVMRTWQPWPAASSQKQGTRMRHSCFPGLSPAVESGAAIRPQATSRQRPCATASCAGTRRTPCHPCSHITLCRSALDSNTCNVLPPSNAQQARERSSQAASGAPSAGVHSWIVASGMLASPAHPAAKSSHLSIFTSPSGRCAASLQCSALPKAQDHKW